MDLTQPKDVIKYCFKCGSHQFDFDGNRAFCCQSCGFVFYINSSAAVAAIIINDKGELLLTVRAHEPMKGFLDLPGGFIDPLESAENAIRREINEELNLKISSLKYLASFPNEYVFSGFSVFTTDLGFVAEVKDFKNIQSNDDISAYIFINPNEIDFSKISSQSIRLIIKSYIENYL